MRKIQFLKLGAGGFILAFCLLFYTYVYHSAQPTNASMPKKESVVIIDAGHGGEDGGAVAADGTVEHRNNIKITK